MQELIKKYKKEVENISRTCETLEDECNALHEVFESLFYTLEVRSGLITPLEFLQKEIAKVLGNPKYIKILQFGLNEFQIIIGTDALIDETKTRSYAIAGIKFTVMESFDRAQRWLYTIDDTKLSKILELYAIKNGGKLWN